MFETLLFAVTRFPFQLFTANLLFCMRLPRRPLFLLRVIPSAALALAFPLVFPDYQYALFVGSWFSFSYLLVFAGMQLLMAFCFTVPPTTLLFLGASAYTAQHLLYHAGLLVMNLTPLAGVPLNAIKLLLCIALYGSCYGVFIRHAHVNGDARLGNVPLLLFTAAALGVINLLSSYAMVVYQFTLPHTLYAMVSCVLLLCVQYGLFEQGRLQKEKEMVEQLLYKDERQSELAEENARRLGIKYHDLRHQLALLKSAGTFASDGQAFLAEVEQAVGVYDSRFNTGNKVLDILLTERKLFCEEHGIAFSCMADAAVLSFITRGDVYSLFGNMLDNALDSVKAADAENRYISLRVSAKGSLASIHCDNYCAEPLTFVDGLPLTTKGSPDVHGFGVKSIAFIVRKYGGTLSMRQEDTLFILDIMLPVPR